jgi:hypothetical protein
MIQFKLSVQKIDKNINGGFVDFLSQPSWQKLPPKRY